jgi:LuxR family maltose regulon positive regulatory protein
METKLTAPRVRDETVRRDRLLRRLDATSTRPLTLVACPAGFGKSSLLASWYDDEAARRPVAWLTLDKADNDPVVLWSYLLEALRRACPTMDESIFRAAVVAPMIVDVLLPRLVNALATQPLMTLILEDFHELTDGPARDSVTRLIGHAPRNVRIVLSTRKEPDLPLATMRARGELNELRADDLRFTLDEAEEFLNGREELGLTAQDVALLVERTAGWPAGLYLAALSLRAVQDRHRQVARFTASNRHVIDYLEAEVLAAHDPADLELLIRSSVLDRITGPVCDALLDRQNSDEALRRLARTNLFVVPLDDDSDAYRLHPVFAQLMRVELGRLDPDLAIELRRRAYTWHRDHGNTADAIGYAIDARMFAEASDIIVTSWFHWTNVGMYDTVLSWVHRLPHAMARGDVRLQLVQGWTECLSRRKREATVTIGLLEERLSAADTVPMPDGFSCGRASLATMQAVFSWGDQELGYSQARRAVELEGPASPWRPVVCWAMGLNLLFRGELAEADTWLVEAASLAEAGEQWLVASTGYAYRSLIAGRLTDSTTQARHARQATEMAREHGLDDAAAGPSIAAGASLQAQGSRGEALPLLEHAVVLARFGGQLGVLAVALDIYASLLCEHGEHDRAKAALREARSYSGCGWPSARDQLCLECRGAVGMALTERERTVLSLLDSDLSESDIARQLFVSRDTVHSHTKSIYRKLGASTRAEAVALARAIDVQHP